MSSVGLFVRATQEDRRWTEGERVGKESNQAAPLSGEEASDFYRNLFTEERGDGCRIRRKQRRGKQPQPGGCGRRPLRGESGGAGMTPGGGVSVAQEREGHRLLHSAQDGDVRMLRELLSRGGDVNFRDSFYWTPIMCASHAGQTEAVRLLLRAGAAWVGVVDKQGRDARDLAVIAGHQDVVSELEEFSIIENRHSPRGNTSRLENLHLPRGNTSSASAQWCAVCEVTYTENAHTHCSSTLHQFSLKHPMVAPQYCLPPSSASYRMMVRSGWDPTSGLGPAHTGRRHPIGTVLKRDQGGLGFGPPPQARVTHFHAKDPQAVQRAPKERRDRKERGVTLSTRALKRKEHSEREWERDYRTSFHINV